MGADARNAQQRIRAGLLDARDRLDAAGNASPAADARALVEHAAQCDGPIVLADTVPDDFEALLEAMLERRCAHEPLQLIRGWAPFRRLRLEVEPGVFVPRPETELVIDLLRDLATPPLHRIVDLCTGTGAIAAAVLDEVDAAQVTAVEVDERAAALAQRNLRAVDPDGRGTVRRADVRDAAALADLRGIDAVLSNPPYIPPGAIPRDRDVREHDPERALYGGGADGLEIPADVIARAGEMLRPSGLLVMEHADVQGAAARVLAAAHGGFEQIRTVRDLTGRDRFLVASRRADASLSGAGHVDERLNR